MGSVVKGEWAADTRFRLFCLLMLATLCLAAGVGLREPSPPDEPRFVMAAKDMIDSGNWLVPHRGREFYAEKPPVFMWMQAAGHAVVGNWRIAFLLPSLIAGLLTLWLTYDLARRLWSREAGLAAATALWLCLQFGLQAKRGQIDMTLVAMTTFSVWALTRHLLHGPAWRWLWAGAFAAGLGTVTKGVGFLPLLLLLPFGLLRARGLLPAPSAPGGAGRWWLVVPAFLAGVAVWLGPLVVELVRTGDPQLQAYAQELIFRQTGERYLNAWHHVQPVWYYVQVMATLWLPGVLFLPRLAPAWWRDIRAGDPAQVLLLSWSVLVLVFFTASPGKREVYIFPVLPVLCVAAAPYLREIMALRPARWTLAGYTGLLAGIAFASGVSGLLGLSDWAVQLASQRGIGADDLRQFLQWLAALGVAGLGIVFLSRGKHAVTAAVIFTGMLWFTYGVGLAPAVDDASSARAVMQRVGQRIGPAAELGLVAWAEQNRLQADRPTVDFGFKAPPAKQWEEAARWVREAPEGRWLFVLKEVLPACVAPDLVESIGRSNRREWVLVPGRAVPPSCVVTTERNTSISATGSGG